MLTIKSIGRHGQITAYTVLNKGNRTWDNKSKFQAQFIWAWNFDCSFLQLMRRRIYYPYNLWYSSTNENMDHSYP